MTNDHRCLAPDAGISLELVQQQVIKQTERVRVCGFARRSCQENRITHVMKDMVSKDPLIERIGTHGKFQLRAFLIIQFVGVFAGWQLYV